MLRNRVPEFDVRSLGDGKAYRSVKFKTQPTPLVYRRGMDVAELRNGVLAVKSSFIDAPCGSGKTVHLPLELLKAGAGMVVHLQPTVANVVTAHREIVSVHGPGVVKCVEVGEGLPENGWVMMTPATYNVLQLDMYSKGVPFPKHWLYHDETHSSDWATVCVRIIQSEYSGCERYIQATGTAGTGGGDESFVRPTGGGTLERATVVDVDPSTWDVWEDDAPYAVKYLTGDVLYVTDNPTKAAIAAAKYAEIGLDVRRLHARSSPAEVLAGLDGFGKSGDGTVRCLVADWSYATGHNFGTLGTIINGGDVRQLVHCSDGSVRVDYRQPRKSEVWQLMARGARNPGQKCVYVESVALKPEAVRVEAEWHEVDMAVIVMRAFGYQVPRVLRDAGKYLSGGLPMQFMKVVNGSQPLHLYAGALVDWPGSSPRPVDAAGAWERYRAAWEMACCRENPVPLLAVSSEFLSSGSVHTAGGVGAEFENSAGGCTGGVRTEVADENESDSATVVAEGADLVGLARRRGNRPVPERSRAQAELHAMGGNAYDSDDDDDGPSEVFQDSLVSADGSGVVYANTHKSGRLKNTQRGMHRDISTVDTAREAVANMREPVSLMVFEPGRLYYVPGIDLGTHAHGDFSHLALEYSAPADRAKLKLMGGTPYHASVIATALKTLNEASARLRAWGKAIGAVKQKVGDGYLPGSALEGFSKHAHAQLDSTEVNHTAASIFLLDLQPSGYIRLGREQSAEYLRAAEEDVGAQVRMLLAAYSAPKREVASGVGVYPRELGVTVGTPAFAPGRYVLDGGSGWRNKLAGRLVGERVVQMLPSVQNGGRPPEPRCTGRNPYDQSYQADRLRKRFDRGGVVTPRI